MSEAFVARRGSLLLLLCAALISARAEPARWFDIAPQPLGDALSEYSAMTGMAVLFDSALVAGLRGAGVQGAFSDSQALARLLAGTGLEAHYSGEQGFTLRRVAPPTEAARLPTVDRAVEARRYASLVQHTLWQTLCATALTRPGRYRAAIQLRIDAAGRASESRLLASTGDAQRDAALREALAGLAVALPPPPSMAQPITLLLTQSDESDESDERDTRACPGAN